MLKAVQAVWFPVAFLPHTAAVQDRLCDISMRSRSLGKLTWCCTIYCTVFQSLIFTWFWNTRTRTHCSHFVCEEDSEIWPCVLQLKTAFRSPILCEHENISNFESDRFGGGLVHKFGFYCFCLFVIVSDSFCETRQFLPYAWTNQKCSFDTFNWP